MRKTALGFTLVELLVVISILGSLSAMLLISFRSQGDKARDLERKSDIKQYQSALETYANRSGGVYPIHSTAVNAISLCGSGNPLGDIPCQDDSDTTKHYRYISDASGLNYVLWAWQKRTNTYFVVCSNGNNGELATEPTSASCPL